MNPNDIIIHIHIPRTAGTSLQNHIGDAYSRPTCWNHYHWEEGTSPTLYATNNIPLLANRTKDQHRELKVISGHSTFCNIHKWLRVQKNPKFITFVRDPIKRILSSFNHRHAQSVLRQDNKLFSRYPLLNASAVQNNMTANDYDTLWEFYLDAKIEQNLQCKWITKSFLNWNYGSGWQPYQSYDGMRVGISPEETIPVCLPEWLWWDKGEYNYWDTTKTLLNKFWWISADEDQTQNIKDLCTYTDLTFYEDVYENRSGTYIEPYWTIEDVMQQPNIQKLIDAEKYDYALLNHVKKYNRRPF